MTLAMLPGIETRLSRIELMLTQIYDAIAEPRETREWFSVGEVARTIGKAEFTVRQWCNQGRINANKSAERRGGAALWRISSAEIRRYKEEGLLPIDPARNVVK